MQRYSWTLSVVFFLFASALWAQPVKWDIEPSEQGRFQLKVYKTGLYSGKVHTFVFDRYEGTFDYDPDAPEQASVEFTVQSGSIVCKDDWVSEKDRGKILAEARGNMLAVDKFPTIRFESSGLAPLADGSFTANGKLTIRDQPKPVTVKVRLVPQGGALRVEGSAVVSLEDYGLKPPSAAFGLIGTKSEMDVEFAFDLAPAKE